MDAEARRAFQLAYHEGQHGDMARSQFSLPHFEATLNAHGFTITRSDPETAAVAELLALRKEFRIALGLSPNRTVSDHWLAIEYRTNQTLTAPTAVELLAAVKAALKGAE